MINIILFKTILFTRKTLQNGGEFLLKQMSKKLWGLIPDNVYQRAYTQLKISALGTRDDKVFLETLDGVVFLGPLKESNFNCEEPYLKRALSCLEKSCLSTQVSRAHAALVHNLVYRFVTEFSAYPYAGRLTNLRGGDVFVDIGAFRGYVTLKASHIVGQSGFVIAIESTHENCEFIRSHKELNSCRNIEIIEKALSTSVDDYIEFFESENQCNSQIDDNLKWASEPPRKVRIPNLSTKKLSELILGKQIQRVILSITTNGTEIDLMSKIISELSGRVKYLEFIVPIIYYDAAEMRSLELVSESYCLEIFYPWARVICVN